METTTHTNGPIGHLPWRPVDPITPEVLHRLGSVAAVWADPDEAARLAGATTAALTERGRPPLVLVARGRVGDRTGFDGSHAALLCALADHRPDTVIARSPNDPTAPVRSRRVAGTVLAALRQLPRPVRLLFAGVGSPDPASLRPALVVGADDGRSEWFVDATIDDYDPARHVRVPLSDVASWGPDDGCRDRER